MRVMYCKMCGLLYVKKVNANTFCKICKVDLQKTGVNFEEMID